MVSLYHLSKWWWLGNGANGIGNYLHTILHRNHMNMNINCWLMPLSFPCWRQDDLFKRRHWKLEISCTKKQARSGRASQAWQRNPCKNREHPGRAGPGPALVDMSSCGLNSLGFKCFPPCSCAVIRQTLSLFDVYISSVCPLQQQLNFIADWCRSPSLADVRTIFSSAGTGS